MLNNQWLTLISSYLLRNGTLKSPPNILPFVCALLPLLLLSPSLLLRSSPFSKFITFVTFLSFTLFILSPTPSYSILYELELTRTTIYAIQVSPSLLSCLSLFSTPHLLCTLLPFSSPFHHIDFLWPWFLLFHKIILSYRWNVATKRWWKLSLLLPRPT